MKLQMIAEAAQIKSLLKKGLQVAESELDGLVTDPRKLYQHILHGVHYKGGAVITDKDYWEEMFTYWQLVPVEVQSQHFEEISDLVTKLLTDFQEAGYLNESFAGAVVTGIAKLVGKLVTGFASIICKIAQILGNTQGQQAARIGRRPSQRENALSQVNAVTVIKYVEGMTIYSKKIKSRNPSSDESQGVQSDSQALSDNQTATSGPSIATQTP